MKYYKIFPIFLTICFFISAIAISGSPFDADSHLPPSINLNENVKGMIIINKPAGLQWFIACTIADLNDDGYEDIILRGAKDYVSEEEYTPTIYVIYGAPSLSSIINVNDPGIHTASFTWQSNNEKIVVSSLKTGDIDGDGKKEIAIAGKYFANKYAATEAERWNYRLFVMKGLNNLFGDYSISGNTPGTVKIYASIGDESNKKIFQGEMAQNDEDYKLADVDRDGKDDVILEYPRKQYLNNGLGTGVFGFNPTSGEYYIVYGNGNLPSDINAEESTVPVTRIYCDTSYRFPYTGIVSGDIDGDSKIDLLFPGGNPELASDRLNGIHYWENHTISFVIYGGLLSAPIYRTNPLDLHGDTWGLTKLKRKAYRESAIREDMYHSVGSGDINGDGYDDIFIGYRNDQRDNIGTPMPEIFVLLGNRNYIYSGNLDSIKNGKIKFTSTQRNENFGSKFVFGDLDADGYSDCMVGGNGYNFAVIYGRPSFPDSFQINNDFSNVSIISGGKLMCAGDVNHDGFADIIGNRENGSVFIILGKGRKYETGKQIVKALLQNYKTEYTFNFSDSSRFHLHFTKSGPSANSELYLTNFGGDLPDSLRSIPTPQKVISFIQAEVTNIDPTYTYRVQSSIDYTDSSLASSRINEKDLIVSTWNEQNSKWEKVQTTLDTTLNRATFEVEHLSLFALTDKNDSILTGINNSFVSSIPLTFELSQNYPNPFNPITIIRVC